MAAFTEKISGSQSIISTGISIPNENITSFSFYLELCVFSTHGGIEVQDEEVNEQDVTTYFTTNSNFSGSTPPTNGYLLTVANLNQYARGKVIYLLFEPESFHPTLGVGDWWAEFRGEFTYTSSPLFEGSPIRLGTTECYTVYLGATECSAIYQGTTRIWHRETILTQTTASTNGIQGADGLTYYSYSGSYSFTSTKPFKVIATQPVGVYAFTYSYNASTGIFSYSGSARSSAAKVAVSMTTYYAG